MHRKILFWFLLCFASIEANPSKEMFFWKASSQEVAELYLLGSVHLLDSSFYPLPNSVLEHFKDAKILVLEVDKTEEAQAEIQTYVMRVGRYPKGDNLGKHVANSFLDSLDVACQKLGISSGALYGLKPWMSALAISVAAMKKQGLNPDLGLDEYFAELARNQGKEIRSLESVKSQLDIFSTMPDSVGLAFLKQAIVESEDMKGVVDSLKSAWKCGDEEKMMRSVMKDLEEPIYKELYNKLYDQRNVAMAAQILDMLHSRAKAFVVVGTAHFLGNHSILTELQKSGITIEQMHYTTGGCDANFLR